MRKLFFSLVSCIIICSAAAQEAQRIQRIDRLIQQYINSGELNGATALTPGQQAGAVAVMES